MNRHRAATQAAGLLLTASLALLLAPAVAPAAAAPPLATAKQQAAQLRAAVDKLQAEAEMAIERYDAVEAQLGQAVTAHLLAEQALTQAQAGVASDTNAVDARAAALYEDGGPLALFASVLQGNDLSDLSDRYQYVQSIVSTDKGAERAAATTLAAVARLNQRLAGLAARQTALQQRAATQADAVQTLLQQQQQLLASADAEVRQIEAADEAAARAASIRAFAAQLAAARSELPSAGVDPSLVGSTTPPNAVAAAAIAAARTRLGDPYVWGATGPDTFDCSGLTQWAYGQAGVQLPRVAADQWNAGPHPAIAQLAPGDLLFWATDVADPTTIHHVAIYLGNGYMIAAPHTGAFVDIEPVYLDGFIGAVRPTAGLTAPAVTSG